MERKTHLYQLRERIAAALGRSVAVKEIADLVDVTKQYLNQIETGVVPGPKCMRKFAGVFGIASVEAWVFLSHEMQDAAFEALAPRLVARGVELIEKQSGGIANGDGKAAGAHVASASAAGVARTPGGDRSTDAQGAGRGVEDRVGSAA